MNKQILLGNEAIARAVVEAGCEIACAYPGTPSSEILPAIASWSDQLKTNTAVEWGANEKVAFEVAVAAAMSGKRSVAVMKQVGLNVAADPFMSTALMRQKGGFLVIVADDPGPHSSQTEQDSRMFAWFGKVPCLDPSTVAEAMEMVKAGFDLSERFGITVMLRPTGKVDHAKEAVTLSDEVRPPKQESFTKDAARWICLPASVRVNHPRVNAVTEEIRHCFETEMGAFNYEVKAQEPAKLGVICGGTTFAFLTDLLNRLGRKDIDLLKIGTPVPLPHALVDDFIARHEKVLILEQTYPVIENQLNNRSAVMGRWDGTVPSAGELLPEVIHVALAKALGEELPSAAEDHRLEEAMSCMGVEDRPPTLCPGCPHRSSFFSIRQALPKAINPSDIGCYTLGVRQKGVDTVIDMGASVSAASGQYLAQKVTGSVTKPIVATIGDSTFFHSGMTGLVSAVYNRHAFVLCILDNSTTAMTGGQASPGVGEKLRQGTEGRKIDLEPLCRGLGCSYVKKVNAYDTIPNQAVVKEAWEYALAHEEPAVLIFEYPCITMLKVKTDPKPVYVDQEACIGCKVCITQFNCPGLVYVTERKKVTVDERYCVECGVCPDVCPHDAIRLK